MTHVAPRLTLVPRQTYRDGARDRHVQIAAELSALRMDLKRLEARCTQVQHCDRCRCWATTTLQDTGFFVCRRCALATKENTA